MTRSFPRLLTALILSVLALTAAWWVFLYDPGDVSAGTAAIQAQAEAGNMNSRHALGEMYRLGRGLKKNMLLAYQWHKKAALQGHSGSQYALGRILEQGDGVRQNFGRAFEWYRLAAEMGGSPDADFAMAQMYFHGRGVAQDYAEAYALYTKAAHKGHRIAQHMLGAMYEEGWVDKKDFVEAYKWYTLALPGRDQAIALNPLYDPRRALDRLMPRMTKFQIRRGKQRVRDWRAEHGDPFAQN